MTQMGKQTLIQFSEDESFDQHSFAYKIMQFIEFCGKGMDWRRKKRKFDRYYRNERTAHPRRFILDYTSLGFMMFFYW